MRLTRHSSQPQYWRRQSLEGYGLILPWLLGFLFFTAGPIVASLVMSFTDWDLVRPAHFVALDNYQRALGGDRLLTQAVGNTLYYVAGTVPLTLLLALLLALLLNQKLPATNAWRTVVYLPSVVSLVAMAVLWRWILQTRVGVLDYLLGLVGIRGPAWLGSPDWSRPALILVSLMYLGPQMVIFLAGLKGIPAQLYESAELDGAGSTAKLFHITLPMLSPTIFFNMVTSVIHAFQVFAVVYVMFSGPNSQGAHGPMNSTLVYALYVYEQAFQQLKMGYASALAWLLFIVIMIVTLLQLRASSAWVYYERGIGQ
jgi:multiple sugar transport system permease protein